MSTVIDQTEGGGEKYPLGVCQVVVVTVVVGQTQRGGEVKCRRINFQDVLLCTS